MVVEKKLSILNPRFLKIINDRIKTDSNIVNTRDPALDNSPYIKTAATTGSIEKLVYLLENKADLYLCDDKKNRALNAAVGSSKIAKQNGEKERAQNCYKIFRILLNYEAEQRAYFPEKYEGEDLLKDHTNKNGITPQKAAKNDPEVAKELEKAITEAEEHYKKCLKAKSMGIILKPYHRQFLPIIEETQPETVVEAISSWTQKIATEDNLKNRRIKAGNLETQPLLTPQPALSLHDRKEEPANFVSRFLNGLFGESNNSKTKAS